MNRTLCLLVALLSSNLSSFGQDSLHIATGEVGPVRTYVPLESIRKAGNLLTLEDTLNFKIEASDTLVLLPPGIHFPEGQGVFVPYVPKDPLFLEIYEDVVFGEVENTMGSRSTLKIWKDDIKLYFDPNVPATHIQYLLDFASNISTGIDSLKISEAGPGEIANYRVYYRNDPTAVDQEPRIRQKEGGYYVYWNPEQELERGIIQLNTYNIPNEASVINLLGWHFFRSLGYFQSSSLLSPESYLSRTPKAGPVSEKDLEILKYHYSYSNCIGITREHFNCFHDAIIEKLEETPFLKISVHHN